MRKQHACIGWGVQGDSIPLLRPTEGNKRSAVVINSAALVAWLKLVIGFFRGWINIMKMRLRSCIT